MEYYWFGFLFGALSTFLGVMITNKVVTGCWFTAPFGKGYEELDNRRKENL